MRFAILASLFALTLASLGKGNWHIGCEAGKCSYYPETEPTHLPRSSTPPPLDDPSDGPLPDYEHFDTRCKPDGKNNIVERFNGTHWLDHYTCLPAGSCEDLQGHGACHTLPTIWVIPGAAYLSSFECDEAGIQGKCVPASAVPLVTPTPPEEHHPEHENSTRVVRNGTKRDWAPKRCYPGDRGYLIEEWDYEALEWTVVYQCPPEHPCVEAIHMGSSVANCFGLEEAPSHTQPEPTVDATTLINPHHQAAGRIPTRCDPEDPEHKDVEYSFNNGDTWTFLYYCDKGQCVQLPDYAACQLSNFELFVPIAGIPSSAGHASDGAGHRAHHASTYCSPFNQSEILYFVSGVIHPIAAVCFPPFVCEPPPPDRDSASCEYHPEDAHYEPFGFHHGAQAPSSADGDKDDVTHFKTEDRAADRNKCYEHYQDCKDLSDAGLEECMRKVYACLDDMKA